MRTVRLTDSVTRPANTTQYAAGDVVTDGNAKRLTFSGIGGAFTEAAGGEIRSAVARSSAAQATKADLELWLFSADPATLDADNAAWTPTDAEMSTLLGIIPFPVASWKAGDATAGADGNSVCSVNSIGLLLTSSIVYGVLVVRNTYTPVASEVIEIALNISKAV